MRARVWVEFEYCALQNVQDVTDSLPIQEPLLFFITGFSLFVLKPVLVQIAACPQTAHWTAHWSLKNDLI